MAGERSFSGFAREVGDGWARLVRGAVHGEVLLLPGGSLGIGGEAFFEMNWADVYGDDGLAAADALRAFAGRLRDRGLPGIITAKSAVAEEAGAAAAGLGLQSDDHPMPFMACTAAQARPAKASHDTSRVTDQPVVAEVAQVLGEAFECPVWMCVNMLGSGLASDVDFFLARIEGEAAGVVGTVRVGSTVGVYAVGTRPHLQRRGVASAALSAAMEYHLERGAVAFGLHASAEGAPVYERLGFEIVDRTSAWRVEVGG